RASDLSGRTRKIFLAPTLTAFKDADGTARLGQTASVNCTAETGPDDYHVVSVFHVVKISVAIDMDLQVPIAHRNFLSHDSGNVFPWILIRFNQARDFLVKRVLNGAWMGGSTDFDLKGLSRDLLRIHSQ